MIFTGVPGGRIRRVQTFIESSKKFVLCVCKKFSPSPALIFINSQILYWKTLTNVPEFHILLQLLGTSSPKLPTGTFPLEPTGDFRPPDPLARPPTKWTTSSIVKSWVRLWWFQRKSRHSSRIKGCLIRSITLFLRSTTVTLRNNHQIRAKTSKPLSDLILDLAPLRAFPFSNDALSHILRILDFAAVTPLLKYIPYVLGQNLWLINQVVYATASAPRHLHLTISKVMVIVWRLRGNIIRTVLYIANVIPLQWAQLTKTVHTARLGLEFVFLCFF